ncbi:MAG: winged helix-turn-helix domain-containing protein [Candidatus Bathyarchaeia archaeon]
MKKRTKYEIYFDVLYAVRRRDPTTITRLSYSARLPVDRTKCVVNFLFEETY